MNFTENIAVFIFKQGLVYYFDTVIVRLQNDEIVIYNTVKQAISKKRCIFVQNIVWIFVHLPAEMAEQAQRFLLERQHKIFADNHIHLVGMELACGGIVVNLCGSKNIAAVVFNFRTLFAAENIFNNQLMDTIRLKRVFKQGDIIDADKMQPVDLTFLRTDNIGQVFSSKIIMLNKGIGGIQGLMNSRARRIVGIAALHGLVLQSVGCFNWIGWFAHKDKSCFLVRMNCTDRKGRLKTDFQTA